jgi:hypothetical protein
MDRLDTKTCSQQDATPAQPEGNKTSAPGAVLPPEVIDLAREKYW